MALYYSLYFKLLGREITEYNILPKNIYNIDEKGFLISYLKKLIRMFYYKVGTSGDNI